MNKKEQHVSILIPVLNEETNLVSLFECLRSQTHSNFNVYFSENASDDHSRELIEKFIVQDPRVRVIYNQLRLDAHQNWLNLAEFAIQDHAGGLICWLAGDDYWKENSYLENLVKTLEDNLDIACANPKYLIQDEFGSAVKVVVLSDSERSRRKRVLSLCNNWDLVHNIYGLYRSDIFVSLLNNPLSRFRNYEGSDWWWTYQFLLSNRSKTCMNATYVKLLESPKQEFQFTGKRNKLLNYSTALRNIIKEHRRHLAYARYAKSNFDMLLLVSFRFFLKALIKIWNLHRVILSNLLGKDKNAY